MSLRTKEDREYCKSLGVCVECMRANSEAGLRCLPCAKRNRRRAQLYRANRYAAGLCVRCGNAPVDKGVSCLRCREYMTEYNRNYSRLPPKPIIKKERDPSLCNDCSSKRQEHSVRCLPCTIRNRERTKRAKMRKSA
jgi:hypothetical protein